MISAAASKRFVAHMKARSLAWHPVQPSVRMYEHETELKARKQKMGVELSERRYARDDMRLGDYVCLGDYFNYIDGFWCTDVEGSSIDDTQFYPHEVANELHTCRAKTIQWFKGESERFCDLLRMEHRRRELCEEVAGWMNSDRDVNPWDEGLTEKDYAAMKSLEADVPVERDQVERDFEDSLKSPNVCRLGSSCWDRDCQMIHPDTRVTPCKFGKGCKKGERCPFTHPPECLFGHNCKRGNCCRYSHHKKANKQLNPNAEVWVSRKTIIKPDGTTIIKEVVIKGGRSRVGDGSQEGGRQGGSRVGGGRSRGGRGRGRKRVGRKQRGADGSGGNQLQGSQGNGCVAEG